MCFRAQDPRHASGSGRASTRSVGCRNAVDSCAEEPVVSFRDGHGRWQSGCCQRALRELTAKGEVSPTAPHQSATDPRRLPSATWCFRCGRLCALIALACCIPPAKVLLSPTQRKRWSALLGRRPRRGDRAEKEWDAVIARWHGLAAAMSSAASRGQPGADWDLSYEAHPGERTWVEERIRCSSPRREGLRRDVWRCRLPAGRDLGSSTAASLVRQTRGLGSKRCWQPPAR